MAAGDDFLFDRLLGLGTAFGASTGRLKPAVGSFTNVLLVNEKLTGVDAFVRQIELLATLAAFGTLLITPDTNLPVTPVRIVSQRANQVAVSLMKVFADVAPLPMTGGIELREALAVEAGRATLSSWTPIDFPEGTSLGISIPGALGLDTLVNLFWMEL